MSLWAQLCFFFGCKYKNCFETFLRSLYLEQYMFFFKKRITFRLRQFLKATFGLLALYILRLRCLGISNTYKNSFCFLSKTETFQYDVEYVPEKSFWARLGLTFWLQKKLFWELGVICLHEPIRVFCSNAESCFGCAIFRTLSSVLWLLTSCVWDVLRYRILIKTAFDFFGKRGLRRFVLCAIVLMIFVHNFRKILGDFTEGKTETVQNDVEYVP